MKIERVLLWVGTAGVGIWLGSNAVPAVWQSWDNFVFERKAQGETATVSAYLGQKSRQIAQAVERWVGFASGRSSSGIHGAETPAVRPPAMRGEADSPPELEDNALIGRLTIPRLGLTTTVREGTGEKTLAVAAGHIPGTSIPGWKGNVAVSGHRDTLFRPLARIRRGDLIHFETSDGRYDYQVSSIMIVGPKEVSVLKASSTPELTLVTCYPFDYLGAAPDRFIVKARQVGAHPFKHVQAELRATSPTPQPAVESRKPPEPKPDAGRTFFSVSTRHSRQVAPGISIGVDSVDAADREVNGWLWVMPDRRTIWLREHRVQEPLVFYQDGQKRELKITRVAGDSVTGYLVL